MNNIIPGSFQLMKKINTGLILDTIKLKGPISRADIARLLSLTPATVTNITAELIDRNIIAEGSLGESSGGRKPVMLALSEGNYYFVGIEIDIYKVRVALLDIETKILYEDISELCSDLNDDEVIRIIIDLVHSITENNSIEKAKIRGIGMGINGIVNFENGIVNSSPVFKSENIELRNILEREFNIPVLIDRDVRAMAVCESWFGAGREAETFLCVNVGSSICTAVINNKQTIRGISDGFGEIGHMKICSTGPICSCGERGCLETLASEKAILEAVDIDIPEGKKDMQEIHRESMNGKKEYISAIVKAGEHLGIGIANLINTFNPAIIIIGGNFINMNDFYFNSMLESAERNSLKQLFANVQIKKAETKNDSVIKGAGLLIFKYIFDNHK